MTHGKTSKPASYVMVFGILLVQLWITCKLGLDKTTAKREMSQGTHEIMTDDT